MTKFLVYFVVALALNGALARPKKSQTKSDIDQFVETVDTVRKNVEDSLKSVLPDSKDVNKVVLDVSKTFAAAVEKGAEDLSKQADKNKPLIENLFKEASAKITESVKFLQGLAGEDITKRAEEVKKLVESHVNSIFVEGKKVEDAIKPSLDHAQEAVKNLANDFLQKLTAAGERLKADIDRAVAEKKQKQ